MEHPAIRVARAYQSKEFVQHAKKQLVKDPINMALLLGKSKKGDKR